MLKCNRCGTNDIDIGFVATGAKGEQNRQTCLNCLTKEEINNVGEVEKDIMCAVNNNSKRIFNVD